MSTTFTNTDNFTGNLTGTDTNSANTNTGMATGTGTGSWANFTHKPEIRFHGSGLCTHFLHEIKVQDIGAV